jgi:hypothetical protein
VDGADHEPIMTDGEESCDAPRKENAGVRPTPHAALLAVAAAACLALVPSAAARSAALDPPAVSVTCTPAGETGCDGWFTGDVSVSFSWTIPAGEAFWSETGCNGFAVTSDTGGLAYSCTVTVTSATDRSTSVSKTVSGSIRRDATPPTLADVKADAGNASVALSWAASDDAIRVEVTRAPGPKTAIYDGLAKGFDDTSLRNRTRYAYTVSAFDAAGNRVSATVSAMPTSPLVKPEQGAVLAAPPTLAWKSDPDADYYNVQLFRGGTKVLTAWPVRPWLVLRRSWTFGRRPETLASGRYRWYVWPGRGDRTQHRYGKLIGSSAFVVRR